MDSTEVDRLIGELEIALDRLRSLYEQYFMGIERIEPAVARKDVERRFQALRKEQIRNTALRFRFQMVLQRYNTYQPHWQRICREIENGTYKRLVSRARRRFGSDPPRARKVSTVPPPVPMPVPVLRPGDPLTQDLAAELAELDKEFAPMAPHALDVAAPVAPAPPPPVAARVAPVVPPSGPRVAPPVPPSPPRAAPPVPVPLSAPRVPPPVLVPLSAPRAPPPVPVPLSAPRAPPPVPVPLSALRAPPPIPPSALRVPPPPFAAAIVRPAGAPMASGGPPAAEPSIAPRPRGVPPPVPRPPPPASPPQAPSGLLPSGRPSPDPLSFRAPPLQPPAAKVPHESDDISEDRVRQIYAQYMETRRRQNETASMPFDSVARNLRESSARLREKHGKPVDFEVMIKDGKAFLRPVLK